jgi:hypothetical protein
MRGRQEEEEEEMTDRRGFVVACLVACFAVVGAAVAAQGPEDAAQAAVESWLRHVDGGDYSASWDQAAGSLKGAVRQAQWSQMVEAVRAPLGQLVSRKLRSRQYAEKMPPTTRTIGGKVYTWGGSGPHVVVEFDAVFANKAAAVETVLSAMDADGVWRASAYSVR